MSILWRSTRRRQPQPQTQINRHIYDTLVYLGSGSYGSVYEIQDTPLVLKEHRIFTSGSEIIATDWKHEYDTQCAIYNLCHSDLSCFYSGIVRPYIFSYGLRNTDNMLIPHPDQHTAQSCFFTMDRVPGLANSNYCFLRKLYSVIKPTCTLRPTLIPPYLYLGSLQSLEGHITLDMLLDTQVIEFPNEAYNYCTVEPNSIGMRMLKSMILSFFTIAEKGFIPRDIEFVFNGSCGNTYISILDFNEVRTIRERALIDNYNINIDLAHVYIDLCGIRQSSTRNPQAPYDTPTPQWKFLCSPLVSPYAFFQCAESVKHHGFRTFQIDVVVQEILDYIESHIFPSVLTHMSHVFSIWTPPRSEFSDVYTEFDTKLQMYYVCLFMDTITRRKLHVDTSQLVGMSYTEILKFLQSIVNEDAFIPVNDDMDWMLWTTTSNQLIISNNKPKSFRKRRYTLRRLPPPITK
jgi:hypothetical protein